MYQSEEYSIAIHEAGHAVMAVICQRSLEFVTIIPSSKGLGECRISSKASDKNETDEDNGLNILKEVLILLAGTASESILLNISPMETKGAEDYKEAKKIIDIPNDEQDQGRWNKATKMTWNMFKSPLAQRQIKAVAYALMIHKTITGEQVIEIMKNN